MNNLMLTDKEIESVLYAISLAKDCYAGTPDEELSADVKRDFKAWDRVIEMLEKA